MLKKCFEPSRKAGRTMEATNIAIINASVIAKSFARIHLANLINFGIIPLTFDKPEDYENIKLADKIEFKDIKNIIAHDKDLIIEVNGKKIKLNYSFTDRQKKILFAGGLLNWIKQNS